MLDSTTILYLIAGIGSFLVSLLITPIVRSMAHRLGFVDRPDARRKNHKAPVALGGGLAVFLGLGITMLVIFLLAAVFTDLELLNQANALQLICFAIAATGIVVLGLIDDVHGLRGRYKLLGQVAITALLIWSGVKITGFSAFGHPINLGWFAIPATAFWLLGTTNAVNLIDGIDGLAGSVGLILCLTLAAITGGQGAVLLTVLMLALGGSLLAFLRYNFSPATIYLGDTGSMLIGLICGTVAVLCSAKSSAAAAFAVPIAVWSIPILDSFAALLRRKLTGRSMFAPDRGHLHHSLLVRGWSVQQATLFIALICATTCLSAVLSIYMNSEWIAIATVLLVMMFLVHSKTFGHIELSLLKGRMRRWATAVVASDANGNENVRESAIQLQGSRDWKKLWAGIIEAADDFKLTRIKLTIDIPIIHEAFYATWDTSRELNGEVHFWRITHPLIIDGQMVGQMDITGETQTDSKQSTMSQILQVLDFIEPIEEDIRYIREGIEQDRQSSLIGRESMQDQEGAEESAAIVAASDDSSAVQN